MVTIQIKENSKQAKMFIEYAKTLSFVGFISDKKSLSKTEIVVTGEQVFLKRLKRSAQHAREIGSGIRKGNSLKELMNEL
jgi:hypothetical protein